MSELIRIENQKGKLVVSSREVAINFEKEHKAVLRVIDNKFSELKRSAQNCTNLNDLKFFMLQNFIQGEYEDNQNRNQREWLMTRDGFSFITMGFTGTKADMWKVKYIEAFNKMEEEIKLPKKLSAMEQLRLQYQVVEEHEERLTLLENTMTVDYGQQQDLRNLGKSKVLELLGGIDSPAYKDKGLARRAFSRIWNDFKDYFRVNSYKNTPRKELQKAIDYISNWKPQGKLLRDIEDYKNQINIKEIY